LKRFHLLTALPIPSAAGPARWRRAGSKAEPRLSTLRKISGSIRYRRNWPRLLPVQCCIQFRRAGAVEYCDKSCVGPPCVKDCVRQPDVTVGRRDRDAEAIERSEPRAKAIEISHSQAGGDASPVDSQRGSRGDSLKSRNRAVRTATPTRTKTVHTKSKPKKRGSTPIRTS
jgi:hypothetical protein